MKTTDRGKTWEYLDKSLRGLSTYIYFFDKDIGFVSSMDGIEKTTDGGFSWTCVDKNYKPYLYFYKNYGLTWGLSSIDSGETWSKTSYSIIYLEENKFYYIDINNYLNMSLDFGADWEQIFDLNQLLSEKFTCTELKTYNNTIMVGFLTGYSRGFFISNDFGKTFRIQYNDIYNSQQDITRGWHTDLIYIYNQKNIWFLKDCYYYYSSDGGYTWSNINCGIDDCASEIYFIDENTGFLVGYHGIYKFVKGINPTPKFKMIKDRNIQICEGDSAILCLDSKFTSKKEFSSYWSTGEKFDSIIVKESGAYIYKNLLDCRKDTAFVEVVKVEPKLACNEEISLCRGYKAMLQVEGNYEKVIWKKKGDDNIQIEGNPILISDTGTYYAIAETEMGCIGVSPEVKVIYRDNSNKLKIDDSVRIIEANVFKTGYSQVEINNLTSDTVLIDKVYFKENIFLSIPSYQLPLSIIPNSSVNLKVAIDPRTVSKLNDTLIVEDDCDNHLIPFEIIGLPNDYEGKSPCETEIKLSSSIANDNIYQLAVYPNPAQDYLNISISKKADNLVEIKLIDIHGNILQTCSTKESTSKFDLVDLSNGVYQVLVTYENQILTNTFSIVR